MKIIESRGNKAAARLPELSQAKPPMLGQALPWWRDPRVIAYGSFAVALVLSFAQPLYALAVHAAGSDLHSHILLVPLISAYVLRLNSRRLPGEYKSSLGFASIPFFAGVAALASALRWAGVTPPLSHNDYLALMAFAFVCLLVAGGFTFLGRRWMAAAAFPFAFLLFMIPLPDRVVDFLEKGSLYASADAANLFFITFQTPVWRDGVFFHLPGIVLEVAQECSGIRSSWVLFITSVLASHLFLISPWRRVVLVAVVVPLAILRNGFRIFVIALLCVHIGPHMVHSLIHRRGGPLFFALSLIPLVLILFWLRRGEVQRSKGRQLASAHEQLSGEMPRRGDL